MPITTLEKQQRLRQIGEIHLGHVVAIGGNDRRGKPRTKPEKLTKFRFTTKSPDLAEKVAALYGGEVKPWTPANNGPSGFEVFSTVDLLPILIRPRAVSQWFELYEGRRCVRRCDGEREFRGDRPCLCDPKGVLGWSDKRECSIATRLNVMLRDLPAIGEWLLTSTGANAAVEIPPLAHIVAAADGYVNARLGMEPRETFPFQGPSFKYMVPVLHVDLAPLELLAGGGGVSALGGGTAALGSGGQKAIAAAPIAKDDPGREFWKAQADSAATLDALAKVVGSARAAGQGNEGDEVYKHFLCRRAILQQAAEEAEAAAAQARAADDGIEDAEVLYDESTPADPWTEAGTPDPDLDDLWFRITENAPRTWKTDELAVRFKEFTGKEPKDATADHMRAFLTALLDGSVA